MIGATLVVECVADGVERVLEQPGRRDSGLRGSASASSAANAAFATASIRSRDAGGGSGDVDSVSPTGGVAALRFGEIAAPVAMRGG